MRRAREGRFRKCQDAESLQVVGIQHSQSKDRIPGYRIRYAVLQRRGPVGGPYREI